MKGITYIKLAFEDIPHTIENDIKLYKTRSNAYHDDSYAPSITTDVANAALKSGILKGKIITENQISMLKIIAGD